MQLASHASPQGRRTHPSPWGLEGLRKALWVTEPLPGSFGGVPGRTREPLAAQAFAILGWNTLCHHRLMDALVAVRIRQRSGHLLPARFELTLRGLFGSHGFTRHLPCFRNLSRVSIVMFPEGGQLLFGGAFRVVVAAMFAALLVIGMVLRG